MKEAAGQANMTVIVIVLIGVVGAVGMAVVPSLLENVEKRAICNEKGGEYSNNRCRFVTRNSNGNSIIHDYGFEKCDDGSWALPWECPGDEDKRPSWLDDFD